MSGFGNRPRRTSLQNELQDRVKRYIIENGHRTGDPLPTESHLAEQMGVSRSSLREAMRVLQTIGVVESRHGSGTFVGSFRMESLLEGMTFSIRTSDEADAMQALYEILEVRSVLERHLIRQVAECCTGEQLDHLDHLLTLMRARADARQTFPDEDMAFHEHMYSSMGNSFFMQLVRTFWQLFSKVEDNLRNINEELHAVVDVHQNIVDALRTCDADAAELAMTQHLDGIRERVSNARWS